MWRPIRADEIKNGTAVNAFGKDDTSPYSVSTIIAVYGDNISDGYVRLARPIAFASDLANQKQPLFHVEVYEIAIHRLLEVGIVWADSDNGRARSFIC